MNFRDELSKELLTERNASRVIDGEKVKFNSKAVKAVGEIIDWVTNPKSPFKLKVQSGDWEVEFTATNKEAFEKLYSMYGDVDDLIITQNSGKIIVTALKK